MALDEKKKRIVAGVLVLAVVVIAYKVLSPMISDNDGHRAAPQVSVSGSEPDRAMPPLPDAPKPETASAPRTVGTTPPVLPISDNSPAASQATPVIASDKPVPDSGTAISASPATPAPTVVDARNDAPASGDIDTLLSQAQRAELNSKVTKLQSDTRKVVAESAAREAEAHLAEVKAHAEAHYIGSNPDRYAQQTMKAGGLDAPPGLPVLSPYSSGQQGSSGDADTGLVLRLISGEGKDRFAVVEINGVSHSFRSGSNWGGYTLKSIHDDSVDLEYGGKTTSLSFDIPRARPMQAFGQSQPQQSRGSVAPRVATPGDSSSMALGYNPGQGATVTPIGSQGGSQGGSQHQQGGGGSSDTAYGSPGY